MNFSELQQRIDTLFAHLSELDSAYIESGPVESDLLARAKVLAELDTLPQAITHAMRLEKLATYQTQADTLAAIKPELEQATAALSQAAQEFQRLRNIGGPQFEQARAARDEAERPHAVLQRQYASLVRSVTDKATWEAAAEREATFAGAEARQQIRARLEQRVS